MINFGMVVKSSILSFPAALAKILCVDCAGSNGWCNLVRQIRTCIGRSGEYGVLGIRKRTSKKVTESSGICVHELDMRSRRRRPDWDNTVHDLKSLKLTTAELDARSKSFKSRDWSRPTTSGSLRSSPEQEIDHLARANVGHPAKKKVTNAPTRIRVRKDFVTLKERNKSSIAKSRLSSSDDDDFDEDIRRLEYLQRQQPHYAAAPRHEGSSSGDPTDCTLLLRKNTGRSDANNDDLLEYLETEMHKAWSEMSIRGVQGPPRRKRLLKRNIVRRRMRLQIGRRKMLPTNDIRLFKMLLDNQTSRVLPASQSFIQELQKHVKHQEKVIEELNEFRMSATKELTTLVVLVQKMLTIQESKVSPVSLPAIEQTQGNVLRAKDTSLPDNMESAKDVTQTVNQVEVIAHGTPPKPREVPIYLKQRVSSINPLPLRLQDSSQPSSYQEESTRNDCPLNGNNTTSARVIENKRRLPSADKSNLIHDFSKEESDTHAKCIALPRGPYKKSRLQDHHFSPPRGKANRPGEGLEGSNKVDEIESKARDTSATEHHLDSEAAPQSKPAKYPSTICLPTKKPNLEQGRIPPRVRKNNASQPAAEKYQSKAVTSQMLHRPAGNVPANKRIDTGPRFTLQGWSAAFLQPDLQNGSNKLRGKENNHAQKTTKSSFIWTPREHSFAISQES